ncbi:Octanoyltransferase [Nesidiocoris tenuis]|uniref:lipoyl(octanoyl) transferase n=1 Tax=Nesidiocoris tenuis TaxID=355587 RepID=A0ABN7ATT2_9HEMI|nr:Octanoyltransferase [Nesidiocoris tenuis]
MNQYYDAIKITQRNKSRDKKTTISDVPSAKRFKCGRPLEIPAEPPAVVTDNCNLPTLRDKFSEFNNEEKIGRCRAQGKSVVTSSTSIRSKSEDDGIYGLLLSGDIAVECERLLNVAEEAKEYLVLGLDLDWPSSYKASIAKISNIHLCYGENRCILFDVTLVKKLPLVFVKLIQHPNVRLIGRNIIDDLLKLGNDFNFDVKQVVKSNLVLASGVKNKLSCSHRWSFTQYDPLNQACQPENGAVEENYVDEEDILQYEHRVATFPGKIKFFAEFHEIAVQSDELLTQAEKSNALLVLGFDLEWPCIPGRTSGKVALMQICPDDSVCYLFHIYYLKALPKALVVLLKHSNVRLTGLNIANDIRKLARDFGIDLSTVLSDNLIELNSFANEKLRSKSRWSLAGLTANQLKLDLDKGPVRVSNWSKKNLTRQQLMYAATDAYVSLKCYQKLDSLGNAYPWEGGVLLVLEHKPVYTIGLRTKGYDVQDEERLRRLGADFQRTDRGGLITFHGHGQLVVYPILDLRLWKPSVKWYVENLEDTVIGLCSSLSVAAHRYHPYPGIWVGEKKLCAVGIHASRYVTTHGIAINCNTDLRWFEHIVPCGIEGKGVTSLTELLSRNVNVEEVVPVFLKAFEDKFSCELVEINDC